MKVCQSVWECVGVWGSVRECECECECESVCESVRVRECESESEMCVKVRKKSL